MRFRYLKIRKLKWTHAYLKSLTDIGALKYTSKRYFIVNIMLLSNEQLNKFLRFDFNKLIAVDKIKYASIYQYNYISLRTLKFLFRLKDEQINELKDEGILIYKSELDKHYKIKDRYLLGIHDLYETQELL